MYFLPCKDVWTWQAACGRTEAGLVPRAEQEAGTSSEFWAWRRVWKEQGKVTAGIQMGRGYGRHSSSPGNRQRLKLSWQGRRAAEVGTSMAEGRVQSLICCVTLSNCWVTPSKG